MSAATPIPVPRRSASVVLLRAGASGPQVLLVKRPRAAAAFGGAYVFPGGAIDPGDAAPGACSRVRGLSAAQANARMDLADGALDHWVGIVRECFEETGILLARGAPGLTVPPAQRAALRAGALSIEQFLDQNDLQIDASQLVYFDHWITPVGEPRRFDTRFFVAEVGAAQPVALDGNELVDARWLAPREALAQADAAQIELVFVTRVILQALVGHASPVSALDAAHALEHIPMNRPRYARGRTGRRVFWRAEPPFAEIGWLDPTESGEAAWESLPGEPKCLDRWVTRILAPNAGMLTGPGTNTYLVGRDSLAVIDPGPEELAHLAAIEQHGGARIAWILLTHTHPDHAAGAEALRRRTGAHLCGRQARPGGASDVRVAFDRELEHGETVSLGEVSLEVVATPGHASNHLCYFLRHTGMLFTGDHLVQGSTVVIAPPDGSMRQYLHSLQVVGELGARILAPGHGYLIGEPAGEVRRLLAHRLARENKVRDAVRSLGPAPVPALLPRVYDDVPAALHALAARSLTAHLLKLAEDGQVRHSDGRWSVAVPQAGAHTRAESNRP